MPKRGLFVTFEGCDGCGKTTVMGKAAEILKAEGLPITLSREPGGVLISEEIRSVILDNRNTMMDGRTEALLYAASRRQHLVEKIEPWLKEGKLILCDRFIDSSLAYQGYARNIGIDGVEAINSFAIDNTWPDVTYFIDVKPADCLARMALDKGHEANRLDVEKLSFHQKVYDGYRILLKRYPDRIVVIDGYQPIENEAMAIVKDIKAKWTQKNSR